jgi:hypothetical protein
MNSKHYVGNSQSAWVVLRRILGTDFDTHAGGLGVKEQGIINNTAGAATHIVRSNLSGEERLPLLRAQLSGCESRGEKKSFGITEKTKKTESDVVKMVRA